MTLTLESLTAGYRGAPTLRAITARLEAGTVAALVGPNGSGKSTLLKAVAGLLPAAGAVRLDGASLDAAARRRAVAYMPQEIGTASALTLLEVVLLGQLGSLGLRVPREAVATASETLERFGLGALADRRLDQVSGGQRQLAHLSQALVRRPRVLLLDEPTAALDLRHQLIVLEAVRAHALAAEAVVVVAIHDLTLAAQIADAMLCLSAGRLEAAGAPAAVLAPALIARVWGVEAEVEPSGQRGVRVCPVRPL